MGKSTINGPFSIAMLVYQRVNLTVINLWLRLTWPPGKKVENLIDPPKYDSPSSTYLACRPSNPQWWEKNSHPVDMTLGEVIMVMNDLDTEMSVYPTTVVDPNLIKKSRVSKLPNTQKNA